VPEEYSVSETTRLLGGPRLILPRPLPAAANPIGESRRGEDVVPRVDDMDPHRALGHHGYGGVESLLRRVIGGLLNTPGHNPTLNGGSSFVSLSHAA
jgi:hypothetical protein